MRILKQVVLVPNLACLLIVKRAAEFQKIQKIEKIPKINKRKKNIKKI